jgi:hypothetical protein
MVAHKMNSRSRAFLHGKSGLAQDPHHMHQWRRAQKKHIASYRVRHAGNVIEEALELPRQNAVLFLV